MIKIFKLICRIFLMLSIVVFSFYAVAYGGFGPKIQHYFWKSFYYITNPKNEPVGEIVIDLKQGAEFIKNNSSPKIKFHTFTWRTGISDNIENAHLGLQNLPSMTPFSYFTLKITLDESTIIIPNFLTLYVYFKDFYNSKYRMEHPTPNGINSVRIYCIDRTPILENDNPFKRRTDYDFAFSQHQQLASMFDTLGFSRDIKADEIEKNNRNRNAYLLQCVEYKEWVKDDFKFILWLEHSEDEYWNCIHIVSKNAL